MKDIYQEFPGGSEVKASACNVGDMGSIPGLGRFPWRRKWQHTPVFLPGESHGWRSLVGYNPWGRKESETTEWLHFHFHHLIVLETRNLKSTYWQSHALWASREGLFFAFSRLQVLLTVFGILCIVGAPLQSLPPSSHSVLPWVCPCSDFPYLIATLLSELKPTLIQYGLPLWLSW